ncbi:MAG: dienelactone hydrolase family protein [Proteobacteria bacterium]|nr:dienelactone hydrolase family protein [Pseudomonadota bacterium]
MGSRVELTASDGHILSAYRADPQDEARGGIVVVQEVFGVNEHVRGVCDGYAADGYAVVAPALFDRVKQGVELGYEGADLTHGREFRAELGWDNPWLDVEAAAAVLRPVGKVAVIGYCFGGSVAWLAATRLVVDAAVGYYGGQVADFIEEEPKCPVLLHFGESDAFIPIESVDKVQERRPDIPLYRYPAGHGFNCESRADYHEESAKRARTRTLDFIRLHIG